MRHRKPSRLSSAALSSKTQASLETCQAPVLRIAGGRLNTISYRLTAEPDMSLPRVLIEGIAVHLTAPSAIELKLDMAIRKQTKNILHDNFWSIDMLCLSSSDVIQGRLWPYCLRKTKNVAAIKSCQTPSPSTHGYPLACVLTRNLCLVGASC